MENKKKRNVKVVVLIIIAVILVVAVIGGILFLKQGQNEKTKELQIGEVITLPDWEIKVTKISDGDKICKDPQSKYYMLPRSYYKSSQTAEKDKTFVIVSFEVKYLGKENKNFSPGITLDYNNGYKFEKTQISYKANSSNRTYWENSAPTYKPLEEGYEGRAYFSVPKEVVENKEAPLKLILNWEEEFIYDIREKKDENNKNIYALVESHSTLGRNGETKTYSDYTYNESNGLITGYKEGTHTYTLEYDDKGNVLKKLDTYYNGETLLETSTYNEDNTVATSIYSGSNENNIENGKSFTYVYEKDDKGRVIKKTSTNITRDNYTMVYTYEYDEKDRIVSETQTTQRSTYKNKYEYDENNNRIKTSVYEGDKTYPSWTETYIYEVIGQCDGTRYDKILERANIIM